LEVTAMPADDALFEKALARQMRTEDAANGESAPPDAATEQHERCPDAEVLGAYHERSLASDELKLWKEHIYSCARCQEILAQLEATDNVFVPVGEEDMTSVVYENAGSAAEMPSRVEFAAPPAAMQELRASAARTSPTRSGAAGKAATPINKQRRARSYWIVPVGAIAAALLVWVGTHRSPQNILHNAKVETAENRQTPEPSAISPSPGLLNKEKESASESRIDAGAARAPRETHPPTRKKLPTEVPFVMRSPLGAVTAAGNSAGTSAGRSAAKSAGSADAGAVQVAPGAVTQSVQVINEAPPVSQGQSSGANVTTLATGQQLSASQMAAAPPPAAPSQNAQTAKQQAANADAISALVSAQAETVTLDKYGSLRTVSGPQNPHMIAAPGGNIIWRVGKAGLIEKSDNAGAIWTRQNGGVTMTLDSGSAPSATVCWVFGRKGTILQTIDGGSHWAKVVSPISGDIGGILAADSQHATIWDAKRKNNFVTTDGGATWNPVTNP
jgi:hypothetical protein